MRRRSLYLPVFGGAAVALFVVVIAVSLRDGTGNAGGEYPPPESIVSLTPSLTEAVFFLGAGDRIIGRTRFCDYPDEALSVEVVGGYTDIDVEKVLLMKPDLVVVSPAPGNRDAVKRIADAGVRVEVLQLRNTKQVFSTLVRLGDVLGRRDPALRKVEALRRSMDEVKKKAERMPEVPSLIVVDHNPTVLASPGSFPHELLTIAGGRNLVEDSGRTYTQADIEWLSAHPPEVLLDLTAAHGGRGPADSDLVSRYDGIPGWDKGVRIVPLRNDSVTVAGPRMAEAARLIFKILHGGTNAVSD